ncbi:uncharacterized protein LOC144123430 [Amblyomma americanum]
MPDPTNVDSGRGQQPNSEGTGEPRNMLPKSVMSLPPSSHRQFQDAHVTLFCPCSQPSTGDAAKQATGITSAAAQSAPNPPETEDGARANAQQWIISDELLANCHHTKSRRQLVSEQLSADRRSWYDHIQAGRLECELRGCECEQRHSARPGLVVNAMKTNRSACTVLGEWRTLYHLEREDRTQGSALQLR